jgi:hypothetical protein
MRRAEAAVLMSTLAARGLSDWQGCIKLATPGEPVPERRL